MVSGHSPNIGGIGGGAALTTKVAMLPRPADADVDCFFPQVSIEDRRSTSNPWSSHAPPTSV
ncbi:hypothetical protein SSE37_02355 [Sagittula stellata E-37]|uniref:Uncharacterized protein n=1 Tax=Sagittula stellata (strain ATCC 700073 / DSM 11524 / E-37) TaxID=388399 RepID=A3K7S0_SAGS3|nr:hypothetical protein SSE37_02355 [Sagittula stellata E-37]